LALLEREVHYHDILHGEFHDSIQIIIMGSGVNHDKIIAIAIFQGGKKGGYIDNFKDLGRKEKWKDFGEEENRDVTTGFVLMMHIYIQKGFTQVAPSVRPNYRLLGVDLELITRLRLFRKEKIFKNDGLLGENLKVNCSEGGLN